MKEYSTAMILTDANGDGMAQEFLVNHVNCYPHRKVSKTDPAFSDLGPYPKNIVEFCHQHPVGTNAAFRFDHETNKMKTITRMI